VPLEVSFSSCQDTGSRDKQEDAMLVSSERLLITHGFLAVLSDGMGGLQEGEKFSAIATQEMIRSFEDGQPENDMCYELLRCYEKAQTTALAMQSEDEEDSGGATVTAVLIREGKCAYLSVGDSRIYLLRGGGLIQLNREQTLGVRLDERAAMGDLSWGQVKDNGKRKALIAHLGKESGIEPDICSRPQELVSGDRIILMSDGVFGTLSDDELLPLLSGELQACAKSVIRHVLSRKKAGQDNCSVLVIELASTHMEKR